ncbi:diaminopimelate decarboxylase [Eupransor demetentiae]|uniref:Diaminopimelate decarboxylase n=1 Tax=Eupransor demetentiae TaxID=3109584 RepID=A0ABM9N5J8_9LACO|nr:Diaminopimelate decarboxylase (LysA) [Lactobacillaceae bacterium LMG 33000]
MTNLATNSAGHLTIGGCDAVELAHQYGTPLVVYDLGIIQSQVQRFQQVFQEEGVEHAVCYASKAFANKALYQFLNRLGCHADVVSAGEISMALAAGFPAENLVFHGNNKSREELEYALEVGLGTIALDNFHEIDLLEELLAEHQQNVRVILRITPGISAHTHEYIQTGQVDSKFGFDLQSGQADEALERVLANPAFDVLGLHAHIGSQIFEEAGFEMAGQTLVDLAAHWQEEFGFTPRVIDVGGGFGIRYTEDDQPLPPEQFVRAILETIKTACRDKGLPLPAIWIEPGRSLVGPAGYSLYTVGSRKEVPGIRTYLALDGGMGDNIRPALYQADYEAVLANDVHAAVTEHVRLAGKYCESGDILIEDAPMPSAQPGDIVAILATGAYGYSMASNYNLNGKPAVVFVHNGQYYLVTRREEPVDLQQYDLDLPEEGAL